MEQANLVILASPNGRDGWRAVKPEDVPEWVKDHDNMARLMAGEMCMKADEGESGSDWYRARAVTEADTQAMQAAAEKRERRAERNRILTLH